ncbi:YciI family protein [Actinoplanes sp. L3-i22]|uniref:YciI family protein n=1 Tax=Actinoplanes sp. L3-i22 TaxID=2836373 RepID=UPI001C84E529|nr:YciI family protein [Actinoplanes sp. L3-i22]
MEFLCYHRDRPGSGDLRFALREAHWGYMDGFAGAMIARGPTFEGDTLTGSLHVLTLPDAAAARAFAFDEPGYQAGAYRDVLIRRWENRLGRTMWDFPPGRDGGPYFLVLGLSAGPAADLDPPAGAALIAYGPLLSDDGSQWLGTAALVSAASPVEAREILTAGRYAAVEVHTWTFGGRPG